MSLAPWFWPIEAPSSSDPLLVGARTSSLGKAMAAGLRVPGGIVLAPGALDAVLAANDMSLVYAGALASARREDFRPARALALKLKAASWPPEMATKLREAVRNLRAKRLVVYARSASDYWDLDRSEAPIAARQYVDIDAVISAINHCWAFALSDAALAWSLAHGRDPALERNVVIVQNQVESLVTGSASGVDPTLGLVSGLRFVSTSTPTTPEVEERTVTHNDGVVPGSGKLTPTQVVNRPWLLELRKAVAKLEKVLGEPLAVEFAWSGQLHILQVRSLGGKPSTMPDGSPIRWTRERVAERLPAPISTMGWSLYARAFEASLVGFETRFGRAIARPAPVVTELDGYVYINGALGAFPFPTGRPLRAVSRALYRPLFEKSWQQFRIAPWESLRALALAPRGALGASRQDPRFFTMGAFFDLDLLPKAKQLEADWASALPAWLAQLGVLAAEPIEGLKDPQLQEFVERRLALQDSFMAFDMAISVAVSACAWLLEEAAVMARDRREPDLVSRLVDGIPGDLFSALSADLTELYTAVAADSYLSTALRLGDRAAVPGAWSRSSARRLRDAFLANYGHLTASLDILWATLAERSTVLDELLIQRLRANPQNMPLAASIFRTEQLAAASEAELQALLAELGGDAWLKELLTRAVAVLRTMLRLQEQRWGCMTRGFALDRRLLAELGRRSVARGAIELAEDIYFLTLAEASALLIEPEPFSRRRLVARRRLLYERATAMRPAAVYLGGQPEASGERAATSSLHVSGRPVSPGVVEGKVRLVRTLVEMGTFEAGEILVVPAANPCFAALYASAVGLICAHGNALSPGLVSARALGLPAIADIPDVFERLRTGQHVRIDGATGTLTKLGRSSGELTP